MQMSGKHLLLSMRKCDPVCLNDLRIVMGALESATRACGAMRVGEITHEFDPQGVTVVIGIGESHLSIHTWPEENGALADILTCGDKLNPLDALPSLLAHLGCRECTVTQLARNSLGITVLDQQTLDADAIDALSPII